MYTNQKQKGGAGFLGCGFDLSFFGGLMHSPLSNFVRLCRSLHPYLQVSSLGIHPSIQVIPLQLLFVIGACG